MTSVPSPEDIRDLEAGDLPVQVGDHLLEKAHDANHTELETLTDFDRLMALDMPGYVIYMAQHERTYQASTSGRMATASTVFVADWLREPNWRKGIIAGSAKFSLSLTPDGEYQTNKPLVLYTYNNVMREGYGYRRYLAMNAAALRLFGYPLNSRHNNPEYLSEKAEECWQRLVSNGLAEAYVEPPSNWNPMPATRYRFIA